MSTRHWFDANAVNLKILIERLGGLGYDVEGIADDTRNGRVGIDLIVPPSPAQLTAIQAAIAAHDPTNYEGAQAASALTNTRSLMTGLSHQTARDAAYAVVARSYAVAVSAPNATIVAIVDRASAAGYIQNTSWWQALTTAQRQMKTIDLEAEAIRMQAIIAVLR